MAEDKAVAAKSDALGGERVVCVIGGLGARQMDRKSKWRGVASDDCGGTSGKQRITVMGEETCRAWRETSGRWTVMVGGVWQDKWVRGQTASRACWDKQRVERDEKTSGAKRQVAHGAWLAEWRCTPWAKGTSGRGV